MTAPQKTPVDMLETLAVEHARRSLALISATREISDRFSRLADGAECTAFLDAARTYTDACSDALALAREAAALAEIQKSINLLRHIVRT